MVRRSERMEPPTLGKWRRTAAREERRVPEGPSSTGHGAPGASTLAIGVTGVWNSWGNREEQKNELNTYRKHILTRYRVIQTDFISKSRGSVHRTTLNRKTWFAIKTDRVVQWAHSFLQVPMGSALSLKALVGELTTLNHPRCE